MSPLAEEDFAKAIAARRVDAAYDCGDYAAAAEWARQSDNEFHKDLAKVLRRPAGRGRVALPIGFRPPAPHDLRPGDPLNARPVLVEQGGAPLAGRGDLPDGTSRPASGPGRTRAGGSPANSPSPGTAAVALLDLGNPFTLTTVEPASGHLQAVIGYDSVRGTLLIRDPYEPQRPRVPLRQADRALQVQRPPRHGDRSGRQGLLLEGLDLPDADLHDRLFAVTDALARQRDEAVAAYEAMQAAAPGHRLTLQARRSIAGYDSNPTEILQCADAVLALTPATLTRC